MFIRKAFSRKRFRPLIGDCYGEKSTEINSEENINCKDKYKTDKNGITGNSFQEYTRLCGTPTFTIFFSVLCTFDKLIRNKDTCEIIKYSLSRYDQYFILVVPI